MGKTVMESLFRPFIHEPLRHLFRLMSNSRYRTLCRLNTFYGRSSRFRRKTLKIDGWKIETPDVASLISAYREIFVNEIYSFPSATPRPVIVDCGSNIGLSILYFKSLYPESRILAFEADPEIFSILKNNLAINGVKNVELLQKAVWVSDGVLSFSQEGADGGRLDVGNDGSLIQVPSVRLANFLEDLDRVDFLKIDIEGAENAVIEDCEDVLKKIPFAFVEFHSFTGRNPQGFGKMVNRFEEAGFRTHIHPVYTCKRPFHGIAAVSGMDLQLNCFFTRTS
jgi:FkbM family methyltransferase